MKEHDCRLLKPGDSFKCLSSIGLMVLRDFKGSGDVVAYVDSNNFLHNLNGFAWIGVMEEYWLHGKHYIKKGDFDIVRNRIKMLEELD